MTLRGGVEAPLGLGRGTVIKSAYCRLQLNTLFFDHTFYHKKYFS